MHSLWYMYYIRYRNGGRPIAKENSADLLPNRKWNRTRAGVVEGIAGSRTSGRGERYVTGAMALACRYASVPADGPRPLGNPHRSADETRGARAAVPLPRTFGGTWFRKENAGNTG